MLVRRVWPSRPTFDSPSDDFDHVRREMLRLLDSSFGDLGAGVFPPVNITQDDDNFYLRAEVPGIKPDELSISAVRNRVSLGGKREIQPEHYASCIRVSPEHPNIEEVAADGKGTFFPDGGVPEPELS